MHTHPVDHAASRRPNPNGGLHALVAFVRRHHPLFVLTGAGCSTASGIPDYRDADGNWKPAAPIQYQDFMQHHATRQRYWSRSMLGWPRIDRARPNPAHRALAALERAGVISRLVTQNVDGLHRKAGQFNTIELHGRIDTVVCMSCGLPVARSRIQEKLIEHNPQVARRRADIAPDGDALTGELDVSRIKIPSCDRCRGTLKPDVVFFGESVPRPRVEQAFSALRRARGLLVVGSSLTLFSGFRFCRFAADNDIPMAAVNLGRTRADGAFMTKLEMNCVDALTQVLSHLNLQPPASPAL